MLGLLCQCDFLGVSHGCVTLSPGRCSRLAPGGSGQPQRQRDQGASASVYSLRPSRQMGKVALHESLGIGSVCGVLLMGWPLLALKPVLLRRRVSLAAVGGGNPVGNVYQLNARCRANPRAIRVVQAHPIARVVPVKCVPAKHLVHGW